ncbi:MAG: Fic family protein, partial [Lachnospiraceae bacterium]|nr:Fic family protein [Lachnospiraceae bacterium]
MERSFCKILQRADNAGDSTKFVEFMLGIIRDDLKEIGETNVVVNVVTNEEKIIALLRQDGSMSAHM